MEPVASGLLAAEGYYQQAWSEMGYDSNVEFGRLGCIASLNVGDIMLFFRVFLSGGSQANGGGAVKRCQQGESEQPGDPPAVVAVYDVLLTS